MFAIRRASPPCKLSDCSLIQLLYLWGPCIIHAAAARAQSRPRREFPDSKIGLVNILWAIRTGAAFQFNPGRYTGSVCIRAPFPGLIRDFLLEQIRPRRRKYVVIVLPAMWSYCGTWGSDLLSPPVREPLNTRKDKLSWNRLETLSFFFVVGVLHL